MESDAIDNRNIVIQNTYALKLAECFHTDGLRLNRFNTSVIRWNSCSILHAHTPHILVHGIIIRVILSKKHRDVTLYRAQVRASRVNT